MLCYNLCEIKGINHEGKTMNIWDSVQRGLEKATHEAGRIAKIQRLRTTLEGLSKQIETQQSAIIGTAMELFKNGQLTQNELLVLCQTLQTSQQQFAQAQGELKLVQNQGNSGTQAVQPTSTVAYTQLPYQPYDSTLPALVPPPPPGFDPLTVSSLETMQIATPVIEQTQCSTCQATLIPGNVFCHNCGTPVRVDSSAHQPTVRGSIGEGAEGERTVLDVAEQATIRATEANSTVQNIPHDEGNL